MSAPPLKYEIGLGLMARAPQIGKVKTRLARSIGAENALGVYQELLQRANRDIARRAELLTENTTVVYWFVDPPEATGDMARLYPSFSVYLGQVEGNLGQRMSAALEELLEHHRKALLFGADIPDLTLEHMITAAGALDSVDVVFGPTYDGGYSLIGVKKIHAELFSRVTWSAAQTLAESLDVCRRLGISYHLLDELGDLDTVEDFKKIRWRPESITLPDL